MRACLIAAAVLLLTPAAAAGAERWRADVRGAAAWAEGRQGAVTFAVRTDRRLAGRGLDVQVPSASVIKAMLMTAYLRQGAVRARALDARDRALLAPMIRRSNNLTATRIRDLVGNDALLRLARAAGMTRFAVAVSWGSSLITARDQTRFLLRLESLLPARHRAYALRLLRTIVPRQRWGMGQAVPEGWRLYFKGGWGSGTGAVDHQVGLLARGEHRVAIAIMTVANPSHRYGKATLEGVFRRLTRGLEPEVRGAAGPARGFLRASP